MEVTDIKQKHTGAHTNLITILSTHGTEVFRFTASHIAAMWSKLQDSATASERYIQQQRK
jgi:hypothetical protein